MKKLKPIIALALAACLSLWCVPAFAYEQRENIVSYGHGTNNAGYLVIHETANPGASAWNHVNYWANNDDYAVHYVMELDGSVVYQTMPDWALAWHVGNGNYSTVGIELAHATNAADFSSQWAEAVKWAGDYLSYRGWGVDRMLSHDECRYIWGGTDHTDPSGYFAQYGRSWGQFEAAVAEYMNSGWVAPDSSAGSGGVDGFDGLDGGSYACNVDALNVRDYPALSGSAVASYGYGQTVNLDSWYTVADGYVWGRYTAYSGATRYIAVGPHTGTADASDFLVKVGGGASAGGSATASARAYTVAADALNVRSAPSVDSSAVASYGYGQTVTLDGWSTVADGYVWGRYTAYSGATRYIAFGTADGSETFLT
ncbi:N-acetylmuramoyl-L-alanine amidase [Eggerthella guodeyinii]|uniref:N-acetylmuramoyl-L-alanine amidase n=1 Tax=Eggerthella guodeyinii TaxID=2690837 RepID=A0A6N7RNG5_9ACTN|nr:N-acetylmuramoyl-L-alanine amidase [Eggerthella guodeyinii]MRX82268.1 hypothetical protein [Eggerthella guodeyinii]